MARPVYQLSQLAAERLTSGRLYHEFLRVPCLSAGLYVLAAGSVDPQKPHAEDEVYHVVSGRGAIQVGAEDHAVRPGSVVYVPARVDHRFHNITEDLTLLVFFAPAETL